MSGVVLINLLRFGVLILFQVLVVNYADFSFYLNPYVYIMAIMLLPISMPHWLLMLIALLAGFTVDIFSNSLGMHAGAAVFMAFLQPYITTILTPKSGYEADDKPTISSMGLTWFLAYSGILTLLYHLSYFLLEVFSFTMLHLTVLRTLVSGTAAWLLIVMFTLLVAGRATRRR